jgi:hypothetical protein
VIGRDTLDYRFDNVSLFGQDTWQLSPRLSLTCGLRWEINPAPSGRGNRDFLTIDFLDDPTRTAFAPEGTPLWDTTFGNVAPRVGAAYRLSGAGMTILRGGWGIFYDAGSGQVANITAGAPWSRVRSFVGSYPVATADASPPARNLTAPSGFTVMFDRHLRLPYSHQWNVSVEHAADGHTLTASYVGAQGERLLRQELRRTGARLFPSGIHFTTNRAESNYHALQLQYRRRLSRGLQALASYTLSRSVDTASDDSSVNVPAVRYDPELDRGPSNFDVRHVLSAAASYDLPRVNGPRPLAGVLSHWGVDAFGRARSGYPMNVLMGTDLLGVGLSTVTRPDRVADAPVWVSDSTAGGGRVLNRAAFIAAPPGTQGSLPRNAIRGFGAWQVDVALRRDFPVSTNGRLQVRCEVFNVFNQPLFADPVTALNSNLFGRSIQTLANSLGTGGQGGGLSPLYQTGGPRSVQLAVKLLF